MYRNLFIKYRIYQNYMLICVYFMNIIYENMSLFVRLLQHIGTSFGSNFKSLLMSPGSNILVMTR